MVCTLTKGELTIVKIHRKTNNMEAEATPSFSALETSSVSLETLRKAAHRKRTTPWHENPVNILLIRPMRSMTRVYDMLVQNALFLGT